MPWQAHARGMRGRAGWLLNVRQLPMLSEVAVLVRQPHSPSLAPREPTGAGWLCRKGASRAARPLDGKAGPASLPVSLPARSVGDTEAQQAQLSAVTKEATAKALLITIKKLQGLKAEKGRLEQAIRGLQV